MFACIYACMQTKVITINDWFVLASGSALCSVHVYVCVRVLRGARVCVCVRVCVYVWVGLCLFFVALVVCACVCVCMCVSLCVWICV